MGLSVPGTLVRGPLLRPFSWPSHSTFSGVFEIGVPGARWMQAGGGLRGAANFEPVFLRGLLAVLLATPCSAPFLGTAVGLAFASSAPVILAIFIAIGLGPRRAPLF